MSRVPTGRRAVNAAMSSMLLMAVMLMPLAGTTSAATGSRCETVVSEGTFSDCWLDIRSPSSVVAGTAFTLQVAVTTDETKSTVATSDPCGSSAQITIEVDGPTFTTYTTNAKAGIATFNVTLTAAGDYDVFAHEGPPYTDSSTTAAPTADCSNTFYETDEFFPLTVVTIPANAPIAPCPPDTSCVQTTSGSGTQATLIAVAGSTWSPKAATYFEPFAGAGFQCGTSTPPDPNGVLGYTLGSSENTGIIILAMDPRGVGVGKLNVCWFQSVAFTTASGASSTFGDLPACKQRDQVAPCILGKTSGQGGKVGFIRILATANLFDPKLYGH